MNLRRVLHILGLVLFILAGAQLLPLGWCVEGGESRAAVGFLTGAACAGLLGLCMRLAGHAEGELYRREGVLIVVGAWVLASITGAIPYVVSGVLPGIADALFESASGFTTTGATVLTDIEGAGHPILFWRSFTQWLGGIGIVVLFVALLSELGPGARFLFKLEVPGPKAEVLHARVKDTARELAKIYLALSAAEVVLLLVAGVGVFDALTHTFSTVSTGGFSPYSESIGHFSSTVQVVVLVFMLAAGVNFSLYFAMKRRRDLTPLRDSELRVYGVLLGVEEPFLYQVCDVVIDEMSGAYPDLAERRAFIRDRIRRDEERFLETLAKGLALLEGEVGERKERGEAVLPGEVVAHFPECR